MVDYPDPQLTEAKAQLRARFLSLVERLDGVSTYAEAFGLIEEARLAIGTARELFYPQDQPQPGTDVFNQGETFGHTL